MTIGLYLVNTPAYSETFFLNLIKHFKNNNHKIILFVNSSQSNFRICKVIEGFHYSSNVFIKSLILFKLIFRLFLSFKRALLLWNYNKLDGFDTRKNIISLINCAHVLRYDLSWIHFGFAEIAIGKENLGKVINAKLGVSIRGYDVALYPLTRPNCYDLLWKRLSKLHYLSDHLLQRSLTLGFSKSILHQKITPAIDLNLFNIEKICATKSMNKRIILTIARLHWIKGIDDTILALNKYKDLDYEYHIIGDGPEKERLKFLVYELNLTSKVFFHGKQNQKFIKDYLSNAHLYIQYSEHEGFCNSVLEAQAMGIPCIVSNNSGISESILEGISGIAIEPRNPELLGKSILYMLNTFDYDESLSLHWVRENFSLERQGVEFHKFYTE